MPYVGRDLDSGNYLKLDDFSSSFDGSTTTFNMEAGGTAFYPGSAFAILVSVGGVVQEPEVAYTINKSTITFASAPTSNDKCFITVLGTAIGVGVPGNGTVNGNQMAKPFSYDGDLLYLDSTNDRVGIKTNLPAYDLDVNGNANFKGNVSIAGTLTYEDVANIDAVGMITARKGIQVLADGLDVRAGISSFAAGIKAFDDLSVGISTFFVDKSTGRVGIGTNVPGEKLDVEGSLRLRAGGNWTTYATRLTSRLDSTHMMSLEAYHNSSTPVEVLGTYADGGGANMRMVLAAGGEKVGIATGAPYSILTAYGENRSDSGSATGQITAKDNAAYNANPTGGLIFQGHYASNNANAVFGGITGFKENATDGNYAGALAFHTRANGSVAQERLRIVSGGNVGIGTDIPGSLLHVYKTSGSVTQKLECASGTASLQVRHTSGYGSINFWYQGTEKWRVGQVAQGDSFSIWQPNISGGDGGYRLTISNAGKVGLGTNSSQRRLHVFAQGDAIPLRIQNLGSSSGIEIAGGTPKINWFIGKQHNIDNGFEITPSTAAGGYTFSNPALAIKSNGNIGIGENNPSNALVLARSSAGQGEFGLRFQYTDTNGPTLTSSAVLVGSYGLKFKNYNSGRDFLFETGNIGIGENSPGRKVHIKDSGIIKLENTSTGGWIGLEFLGSSGTNNYDAYMGLQDSDGLFFIDNNSNGIDFCITQGGKVGVGIANPSNTLSVVGSDTPPVYIGGANPGIKFEDTNASGTPLSYIYASDGQLSIRADDGNETGSSLIEFKVDGTERLKIDAVGDVHLGSAGNSLYFQNGFNNSNARIQNAGASNNSNLRFLTRSSGTEGERLRINSNGAVGINTTSPQQASHPSLHLHGSQNDDARIAITTPNKPNSRIGYYGLSNRFGIDMHNGFQIRDCSASYATRLTIDSSGKVRFGSGNPAYTFEIQNSGNIEFLLGSTDAGGASIIFDGDGNGDGSGGDYSQIFHDTSGDMNYRARGSGGVASMHRFFNGLSIEGLRIAADGRLLIGSTMTHGSATYYDDITINNSGAGANQAGGTGISLISNSASWGAIIFGDQDDNDIGYLKYDHNNDDLVFGTNNNNRLIIDDSGRFNFGDNQTQTTYPFSVQWDLDSGGTLAYFANSDGTYSQGLGLKFDSSKDITWEGGSGSGGMIWKMGTRGYFWQIGSSQYMSLNSGRLQLRNNNNGENTDLEIFKNAGNAGELGRLMVGYDAGNCWKIWRARNNSHIFSDVNQSDAEWHQLMQGNTVLKYNDYAGSLGGIIEKTTASGVTGALVDTTGRQHSDNNNYQTATHQNQGVGWYTIAICGSGRATGRFGIRERYSSRHQSCTFYAGHEYGGGIEQNCINTIFMTGRNYINPLGALRLKTKSTYDGAALQVYMRNADFSVQAFMLGDNFEGSGWYMRNWIPDSTDPGGLPSAWSGYTNVGAYSDLNELQYGGASWDGHCCPGTDNAWTFGRGSYRWQALYAVNSAIQTSDEVLKQDIAALTTAEMNAAKRLSGLFKTYKWKDAVAEKGSNARIHSGIIAQQVKSAMESEGLDPTNYSFYCVDKWYEHADGTKLPFDKPAGKHDPNLSVDDPNSTSEGEIYVPDGFNPVTRYSVRYEELFAFVAAYNEQRFTSIEARLAALESS